MIQVALLRGINVGGKNRLPMDELTAMFVACGAQRVQTYIQSGNVVCDAPLEVRALVEAALTARFGHPIPVVWRSGDALIALRAGCPFSAAPPDQLHVAFLAHEPTPARVAALDPNRSPGDTVRVVGAEAWLHLPNGVGRSKITNDWLDRALDTTSTVRNLRTVDALCARVREG